MPESCTLLAAELPVNAGGEPGRRLRANGRRRGRPAAAPGGRKAIALHERSRRTIRTIYLASVFASRSSRRSRACAVTVCANAGSTRSKSRQCLAPPRRILPSVQRIASLTAADPRAVAVGSSMGAPAAIRFAVAVRPAAKMRQPDAGHRTAARRLSACQEREVRPFPRPGDGRE
jgi:hypothetical protein